MKRSFIKRSTTLLLGTIVCLSNICACQAGSSEQAKTAETTQEEAGLTEEETTGMISESSQPEESVSGGESLLDIFERDPAAFNCINNGMFSAVESDAPSDEELTRMLDFAMSMGSAHQLTPAHFIVVRNYEEQDSILSGMGSELATPGTVMVLVLADTLRSEEYHQEVYNNWYSQMYYGIFDAGSALGYLNLAANSLGYGTHFYAALNLPVDGAVNIANGGQFSLIEGENWEIEKYTQSQDGTVRFVHTVGTYELPGTSKEISVEGNLSLLCVALIGKPVAGADAVSSATSSVKAANYNFWDPQDGSSYGNHVTGGQTGSQVEDDQTLKTPWEGLPDGVYTGQGKSESSEYTVEAVISAGTLDQISVSDGKENMLLKPEDMEGFLQSMIDAQSLDVDMVAGATQDCQGIIDAMKEAFENQ